MSVTVDYSGVSANTLAYVKDAISAIINDASLSSHGKDEERRQARQPTYVAHVAVAAKGIATEDGFAPLEPGMAVTAEIKTGRCSVINYLLSPLSRFRQEGLRER